VLVAAEDCRQQQRGQGGKVRGWSHATRPQHRPPRGAERHGTIDQDSRLYDFVLDSVGGVKSSPLKRAVKKALKPGGSYVSIDDGDMLLQSARMDQIRELVETGAIKPVLGHTFPINEIVEAHRLVESGHKRGGVAITIAG
jgi:NADPH:quinone reductase-like Zn-dependent oxidoreductase